MKIFYPYNEILPKKKAHDVFIVNECAAWAEEGHQVTLLSGQGGENLYHHYDLNPLASLHLCKLPLLRKNNLLGLSWNRPFFYFCQKKIEKEKPDWVILSVFKQGKYHLARKVRGVRYIYEVHELTCYSQESSSPRFIEERTFLNQADRIVTTTTALRTLLLNPPYSLSVPIEVIPLAVRMEPLPRLVQTQTLTVGYVGQLYKEQGISLLIEALSKTEGIQLKIVGGKEQEITEYRREAARRGVATRIQFMGFHAPSALPSLIQDVDAFVAPFGREGRMAFVAHTKLSEYAVWGRPIIAPALPVVEDHFPERRGVILFEPGNAQDLAKALSALQQQELARRLEGEIRELATHFSWKRRMQRYEHILQTTEAEL